MKSKTYFLPLSLLLLCAIQLRGQNLVPNPSFEEYTLCPDEWAQVDRATGWYAPSILTSPDFFHLCAPAGNHMAVPQNAAGYQNPATGSGYGGVVTYWGDPNFIKEVMAIQLLDTLSVGVPVHLSFKTACGGDGNQIGASGQLSVQGVGMRFSTVPEMDLFSPFNEAAVWLQNVQTDTSAWTTVSGWYTPDSAYTFLQIGNFFADSLLTPVTVFPNSEVATAYAFIDDVCVTYDSIPCDFSLAVATVTTETFGVFPNPSFGYSFITLPSHISGPWEGELVDASGRLVRSLVVPAGVLRMSLPLGDLPTGVYYLSLKTTAMAGKTIKLIRINP